MSVLFNGNSYLNKNLLIGNKATQTNNSTENTQPGEVLKVNTTREIPVDTVLNYMATSALNTAPKATRTSCNDTFSQEYSAYQKAIIKLNEAEGILNDIIAKLDGNTEQDKAGELIKQFLDARRNYEKCAEECEKARLNYESLKKTDSSSDVNEDVTRTNSKNLILNKYENQRLESYHTYFLDYGNSAHATRETYNYVNHCQLTTVHIDKFDAYTMVTEQIYDKTNPKQMISEKVTIYKNSELENCEKLEDVQALMTIETDEVDHTYCEDDDENCTINTDYKLYDNEGNLRLGWKIDQEGWDNYDLTTISGYDSNGKDTNLFSINVSGVGEVRYCTSVTKDYEDGDGLTNYTETAYYDENHKLVAKVTIGRSNETGLITGERYETYDENGNVSATTVKSFHYNKDGSYSVTVSESGRGEGSGYYNHSELADPNNPENLTNTDNYRGEYVESYDANGVLKTITYGNNREGAKLVCTYNEEGTLTGKEFSWKPIIKASPITNTINTTINTTRTNLSKNNNLFVTNEIRTPVIINSSENLTHDYIHECPYTNITQTFNERGQLAEQRSQNADGSLTITRNTYNVKGQLTKEITLTIKDNTETRTETNYQYNKEGKLQRIVSETVETDTRIHSIKKQTTVTTDYIYIGSKLVQKRITTETVDNRSGIKTEVEVVNVKEPEIISGIKLNPNLKITK